MVSFAITCSWRRGVECSLATLIGRLTPRQAISTPSTIKVFKFIDKFS
jgi:hypothetical protein